jgi:hypothetical protein
MIKAPILKNFRQTLTPTETTVHCESRLLLSASCLSVPFLLTILRKKS